MGIAIFILIFDLAGISQPEKNRLRKKNRKEIEKKLLKKYFFSDNLLRCVVKHEKSIIHTDDGSVSLTGPQEACTQFKILPLRNAVTIFWIRYEIQAIHFHFQIQIDC